MFAKRTLALMAMAIVATSALAQEERELNGMMTNKNCEQYVDDYLWPGPKTIQLSSQIVCLANRWRSALIKSWTGGINSKYVLAQYAPDGAVSYKSKPGSGLSTGSQLLPTVSGKLLDTDALRKDYFDNTFLPNEPTPIYVGPFETRVLSKDVVTIAGNWNYTTKTGTGANPKAARVTVVWKRYPKVTVDGKTSRNHWLIAEMHSSPRLCTGNSPSYGQCNVL